MLLPFQRMSPIWGMYTWLIELKIDVLPAPFGPDDGEQLAASSTVNETSLIASTPPKRSWMSSTSSSGRHSRAVSRQPPLPSLVVLDVAERLAPALAVAVEAEVELLDVLVLEQLRRPGRPSRPCRSP